MSDTPRRRSDRLALSLVALLLAIVGPGCVSWDPIFRGSMGLLHAIAGLF